MYGGFVQRFKPRTTAQRKTSDLNYDDVKRLRPRPFRPLFIVLENSTQYSIEDLSIEYQPGADNFLHNIEQLDVEVKPKEEDLSTVTEEAANEVTSDEEEQQEQTTSRRDSVSQDGKVKESFCWNVTTVKYEKYNPVDETPHLYNIGREVAEQFEGENVMGKVNMGWKAMSAKLTKKAPTAGFLGVVKAAIAANKEEVTITGPGAQSAAAAAPAAAAVLAGFMKKPEPKKVDTRPPKEQTKDFIKQAHGKRYYPAKIRPPLACEQFSPDELVSSVFYLDSPYNYTYRTEVSTPFRDTILCEEMADVVEKTDDPTKNIRHRYYKVLDQNPNKGDDYRFIIEKTYEDDEYYKSQREADEDWFLQDVISPRRDSHLHYRLVPHDAHNPQSLKTKTKGVRHIQEETTSERVSITATYHLVSHDQVDVRQLLKNLDKISRRLQDKAVSTTGLLDSPYQTVPHDAENLGNLLKKPALGKRIQPVTAGVSDVVNSPYSLVSDDQANTDELKRRARTSKRIQPLHSGMRSRVNAPYSLPAQYQSNIDEIKKKPVLSRRTQPVSSGLHGEITAPYSLVSHDQRNTQELKRNAAGSRRTQPTEASSRGSITFHFNLTSNDVPNVLKELVRRPQTDRTLRSVELAAKNSITASFERVGRDAIDVRKLVKMAGVGRHYSPGELVEADDQDVLETAKERIVPLDQLPKIKHAVRTSVWLRGHVPVFRSYLHMHWTGEFEGKLIRRKRAIKVPHSHKYHTAVKYIFITECHCEELKPHVFVPARPVRSIHECALYTVFKLEYTAEEEVDEYESPLLWQKRPIILEVRVHCHVPLQREHLAQHLNQQVKSFAIRKFKPILSIHQHKLKTAVARDWLSEEVADIAKIKIVDHKVARFTPYYGASYKAAPLTDKQIYERPDDASLKKTVVDVAGEYKIVLPYNLPQGSDELVREALNKVLKAANIKEPFYMRHIYASGNLPDQIIIVPKSLVDKSTPRIVPTWQVPARTSAYPRTAPATKQIETPYITDLSMPKADKRLIRSKPKLGPVYRRPIQQDGVDMWLAEDINAITQDKPVVKRRAQRNLPLLPERHDYVEVLNYKSRKMKRRVVIKPTPISSVPTEFTDVGTQAGKILDWSHEGRVKNFEMVNVSEYNQSIIEDYLIESADHAKAAPIETVDHDRVAVVPRGKPKKIKIAQRGRHANLVDEYTGRGQGYPLDEKVTVARIRPRKVLTRPRSLAQHFKYPLEQYTDMYIYDPVMKKPIKKFNIFPVALPFITEQMALHQAGDVPAQVPDTEKAKKKRNIRRYQIAKHRHLINQEYADLNNQKLQPIDLIALRPKAFKYQIHSQIPSRADHKEIDEYGLQKNVYLEPANIQQPVVLSHKSSGYKTAEALAITAEAAADSKIPESVDIRRPRENIEDLPTHAAEKIEIAANESSVPDKPAPVNLNRVAEERSAKHTELDFTKDVGTEFMITGNLGAVEPVNVHKKLRTRKILVTSKHTQQSEYTPVNVTQKVYEPVEIKKMEPETTSPQSKSTVYKKHAIQEELAGVHMNDTQETRVQPTKYIYGDGMMVPQIREMITPQLTGTAYSYNMKRVRVPQKKKVGPYTHIVKHSSRKNEEYVKSLVAEEPITNRPMMSHDLEQTNELYQLGHIREDLGYNLLDLPFGKTKQHKSRGYEHRFEGYSLPQSLVYDNAEKPDTETITQVPRVDNLRAPVGVFDYTDYYTPEEYTRSATGTQTNPQGQVDAERVTVVHKRDGRSEVIADGWYDASTGRWYLHSTDGNMAVLPADIRKMRAKRIRRAMTRHANRYEYVVHEELDSRNNLRTVTTDSRESAGYYDYMYTTPERRMITADEASTVVRRVAVTRTRGRPFIEELRSSAGATQWSVTGRSDQDRIQKINRIRLMPKRHIERPQYTVDKVQYQQTELTGPGVQRRARYTPQVYDYYVDPSNTATWQQKTETHSARKRSDTEPIRLLVKGQRYFDDPYEVYDSRELTSNELAEHRPRKVQRNKAREKKTEIYDMTGIQREMTPIEALSRRRAYKTNKEERRPSSYLGHLSQAAVSKDLVSQLKLNPEEISAQSVYNVWPKNVHLLKRFTEGALSDETADEDAVDLVPVPQQTYKKGANMFTPDMSPEFRRTWQYETKY